MNRFRYTAFILSCLLIIAGCTRILAPAPKLTVSDHFDGHRFFNHQPIDHGLNLMVRWMLNRNPGPWKAYRSEPQGPSPTARVHGNQLVVTYVNHATVLIQTEGINILTDPIWSDRAGPFTWLGPHRVRPPGLRFSDLPPIDLVLLSHGHYDHFDLPTLKRLHQQHGPRFVTGIGHGTYLNRAGIDRIQELDWWDRIPIANSSGTHLELWSVPARHWTARWIGDQNRALWSGFVLSAPAGAVYFAGDTGYGQHFAEIRKRVGSPRVALLPVGAFRPRFFMADVHLSPHDALRAHEDLQAKTSVAIHFGTFRLGDDGETEAIDKLAELLRKKNPPPKPGGVAFYPTEPPLDSDARPSPRRSGQGVSHPFLIPDFGEGIVIDSHG